ncbi:kelch repeat and BTB domain-containing protein 13 [Ambystoma mexicanum]|uniref:kelch repeat and BTB domain-containing protein 13 n=1 Tax=Ambystoma mexicanum TaxID=8296 RepID=UPI0037E7ADD4
MLENLGELDQHFLKVNCRPATGNGLPALHSASEMGELQIQVEGKLFTVDKSLLVRSSEYFRALFESGMRESTQEEIQLHGFSSLGFLILIRVLSGERPILDADEILCAIECAAFLQAEALVRHLKNLLNSDNCLLMYHAAATFGLLDLAHGAALYIRDVRHELPGYPESLPTDLLDYVEKLPPSTFVAVGAHTPTFEFLEDVSRAICYLDEDENRWLTLGCLPDNASTFLAGITSLDNKIYIVGGVHGANKLIVDLSFCYDVEGDSWSQFPSPQQLRYDVALVGHEGHLYAIGGELNRVSLKSVEKYKVSSKTWDFVSDLPQPAAGVPCAKAMGRIFVCLWKPLDTTIIYEYHLEEDAWLPLTSIKRQQSYGHCMVAHRDNLYMMRNGPSDDFLRCIIECFNISTCQWTSLSGQFVNSKGALFTAVVRGDTIFTVNKALTLLYAVEGNMWKPKKEKPGFSKGGSLHTFLLRLPKGRQKAAPKSIGDVFPLPEV